VRTDPFLASAPMLNYLFAVTMLAIGSLLPRDEIRQVARRWPMVIGGTAVQYASMPILAYVVARLLGLEGATLIGVVMVGCVPGAMASNVLTMVSRGNVSYSVSLTTSATLFSPLLVPLILRIALGEKVSFDTTKMMLKLGWMVVLPVIVGHLLSRRFEGWHRWAGRIGGIVANLTILWIIAFVVAKNRDTFGNLEAAVFWGLLVINLGGYAAGLLGGAALRLPGPMRRALTLEVGMQNAGLGVIMAKEFFDAEAAMPPAIYAFGCMCTGTILARIWAGMGQREDV
ncbi:MAG: bile acid:sodium symporter family protein, partial [Planctomycetes bacterium]|nr:bile acid:sodium symporter family protein [Planctomycetota bacterium]